MTSCYSEDTYGPQKEEKNQAKDTRKREACGRSKQKLIVKRLIQRRKKEFHFKKLVLRNFTFPKAKRMSHGMVKTFKTPQMSPNQGP